MPSFLIYETKVAAALLVFYLFYRFLLKKETFHRFNRVVLVGTAVLSFLLPLCIITIHRTIELVPVVPEPVVMTELPAQEPLPLVEPALPWWPVALAVLFWAGVAFVLFRVVISILSIVRIIRRGEFIREEDGCRIIVTERDIDPFSWMKYIVFSRKDWEAPNASILAHEKAHIGYGHSVDLLLVDVLSIFQWFNPAIWMLRADLQELHEYEADDAVLRSGANIKEYQYLLIRKAVSKSGYSVANSFNHSILKNRITMMSKSKSPLARGLRVLWMLPLVCLGLALQAQTVYVPVDKDSDNSVTREKKDSVIWIKASGKPESEAIVLNILADGTVESGGKVYSIGQLKEIVPATEDGQSQTTVQIFAPADMTMGVIDDVRTELRGIGSVRLRYALTPGPDGVTRNMVPFPPTPEGKIKYGLTESFPGVDRKNICIVRINSRDKYLFGNKPSQDDEEMLSLGKGFLKEHGKETRFSLQADRGTSYGAYLHMQELLVRIYTEVRNEKALEQYGRPLAELTLEEKNQINYQIPIGISEAEPKKGR